MLEVPKPNNNYKLENIYLYETGHFLFQVRQYQPVKYGVFPLLPLSRHRLSMLPMFVYSIKLFYFIFYEHRYGKAESFGARFR
jgi:hypothetical protein